MATIQDLGKVAYFNKGVYNSETTYEINDVVSYNGSSYVSLGNDNLGNLPTNTAFWSVVAQSAYEIAVENGYEGTQEEWTEQFLNADNYYNKKEINTKNNNLQSQINGLASGSPLAASSVSGMTDTTKLYVNTTDGYVYYYDGDSWERGWVYQSGVDIENLDTLDALRTLDKTLISTNWYNKAIDNAGNLGSGTTNIRLSSDIIEVPKNSHIEFELLNEGTRMNTYFFNDSSVYQNQIMYTESSKISFNNKYVRLQFAYLDNSIVTPDNINQYFNLYLVNDETKVKKEIKNIIDLSKSINGYIYNAQGQINTSDTYETTDFIPVNAGESITFSGFRFLLAYYNSSTSITSSFVSTEQNAPYTFTATNNCFVRITYRKYNKYNVQANYGETLNKEYYRHGYVQENVINPQNILSGKTLVTCGDSFTAYTAATGGDSTHTSENWSNEYNCYKTYPYWIASRNNMNLHNEAISGTTLTHVDGRTNAFSDTRYQNLPKDADFILLKFGINDDANHLNVPIGTINDNTNTTFYGAWNVVLTYMLQNYPNSKIGILATNGSTTDIVNATINIAKKYGLSYLNEGLGEDMAAWFRTSRTDVSSSVKELLLDRYAINAPSDTHPNVEWHKRESSIVEEFIKKLI